MTKEARMKVRIANRLFYFVIHHSDFVLRHSSGVSKHFLDRGVAGVDAAQAVLTQRDHS